MKATLPLWEGSVEGECDPSRLCWVSGRWEQLWPGPLEMVLRQRGEASGSPHDV